MIFQDSFAGNGFETVIPGVYQTVKTVAPLGSGVPRGVLLLVSATNFHRLKPAHPYMVTSRAALRALLPAWGARHGEAIFRPFDDPDVPGGASVVYLVNAAQSTRASLALQRSGGTQLTLRSLIYGLDGNKIWVTVGAGTIRGKKYTVGLEGQVYVLDNVGGTDLFGIEYDGGDATAVVANVNPATGVTLRQTVSAALTDADDDWTPGSELAWDGAVQITLNAANGAGITFTITGTNKTTGLSDTEVVAFESGDTTKTGLKAFSAVSRIQRTAGAWSTSVSASVAVNAIDCPIAQFGTVAEVIEAINARSAAGYSATDAQGDASSRSVATLDGVSNVDVASGMAFFRADVDAAFQAIGNQEADSPTASQWLPWLVAEKGTTITGAPDNLATPTYLFGGTNAAADATSWETALEATRELDVNEGWAETTDEAREAQIMAHVAYQQGRGGRPLHWHFATSAQPSKAAVLTKAVRLNSEAAQLCVNAIQVRDENGNKVWLDPLYTALRLAAGYCGASVPVMPLLRKQMRVLDIRHGSDWTFASDGEELLRSSAVLLARVDGGSGYWVVDDLTTYRRKKDSILTAGSAVRSMDYCRWDLRLAYESAVGQPAFAGTRAAALEVGRDRLRFQRDTLGYINGFSALELESAGSTTVFRAEINPVLPTKFVGQELTFAVAAPVTLA